MALYFFDTIEGRHRCADADGVEVSDEQSAREMAWAYLAEILTDVRGIPDETMTVVVTDADRQPIYEVVASGSKPDPGVLSSSSMD